jgi:hypothetical protein
MRFELGFYDLEVDILHSHRRINLKPHKLKLLFATCCSVCLQVNAENTMLMCLHRNAGQTPRIQRSRLFENEAERKYPERAVAN